MQEIVEQDMQQAFQRSSQIHSALMVLTVFLTFLRTNRPISLTIPSLPSTPTQPSWPVPTNRNGLDLSQVSSAAFVLVFAIVSMFIKLDVSSSLLMQVVHVFLSFLVGHHVSFNSACVHHVCFSQSTHEHHSSSSSCCRLSFHLVIAGSMASCTAEVVTLPIDITKVRLQVQRSVPGEAKAYKGMLDAALKIGRKEGLRGFYKGSVPALLRQGSYSGNAMALREWQQFAPMVEASFCLHSSISSLSIENETYASDERRW